MKILLACIDVFSVKNLNIGHSLFWLIKSELSAPYFRQRFCMHSKQQDLTWSHLASPHFIYSLFTSVNGERIFARLQGSTAEFNETRTNTPSHHHHSQQYQATPGSTKNNFIEKTIGGFYGFLVARELSRMQKKTRAYPFLVDD